MIDAQRLNDIEADRFHTSDCPEAVFGEDAKRLCDHDCIWSTMDELTREVRRLQATIDSMARVYGGTPINEPKTPSEEANERMRLDYNTQATRPVTDLMAALEESLAKAKRVRAARATEVTGVDLI